MCAVTSFLFKVQAAVLVPLFPLLWGITRWRGEPGATWRAWPIWLGGGVAATAPLVLVYASEGALIHLWRQLFPVWAYLEYVTLPAIPVHELLWRIPLQLWTVFPTATAGAVFALCGALATRRRAGLIAAAAFCVFSVSAGGLGGPRYYLHYAIQYLPGLAILAAHPAGILGLSKVARPWRLAAGTGFALILGFQLWQTATHRGVRFDYRPRQNDLGQTAAHLAGEHIRNRTQPEDTVHVWGWDAWPVYYWSQRFAPTPMYKELGLVTVVNTNTYWTRSKPMPFKPGCFADMLLAAFKEKPPAYFVYSPYYQRWAGDGVEPLTQFEELTKILKEQYVLEASYDTLDLYVRHDRISPVRPSANRAPSLHRLGLSRPRNPRLGLSKAERVARRREWGLDGKLP